MADIYTHKDLARLCGVSETTIKSYRRKFPGFIPVLTKGKPIRFRAEAGDVCLKIRDCFAKGMSVGETRKVLKENFKEELSARRSGSRKAPAASAASAEGFSQEYLEKFFETTGQMMHGMAGLATAQARAEQRLRKVESALKRLLEAEAANREILAALLEERSGEVSAESFSPQPEPEHKVRARKIVNVHGPEGGVESYALEEEEPRPVPHAPPPDEFLNTPIVIRNDRGEFLGVPGRLPLAGFLEILVREAEEGGSSLSNWSRLDDAWVYTIDSPGRETHALHFIATTTPRGNQVALLDRLDVNGRRTSPGFLQEFFRQVKDKAQ
ncbi:MAG: MerR family transcriptional regulator [Desulfovibrionaceae bacterium]|nr:MerR family transcriptional regulator [Desulfovibrionaceae bacterium]